MASQDHQPGNSPAVCPHVWQLGTCLFDRSKRHWRRPSEWRLGWECGAGGNPQHAPLEAPGPSLLVLEWKLDPAPRRVGGTVLAGSHHVEYFTLEFPNQSGWQITGHSSHRFNFMTPVCFWEKKYYSDSSISLVCALCSLAGSLVLWSQWKSKKNKWGQWHAPASMWRVQC